jgi:hypothetical protein
MDPRLLVERVMSFPVGGVMPGSSAGNKAC